MTSRICRPLSCRSGVCVSRTARHARVAQTSYCRLKLLDTTLHAFEDGVRNPFFRRFADLDCGLDLCLDSRVIPNALLACYPDVVRKLLNYSSLSSYGGVSSLATVSSSPGALHV